MCDRRIFGRSRRLRGCDYMSGQDPFLDGKEPETLIDEDSEYIVGKDGWDIVPGNGSYGRTYLKTVSFDRASLIVEGQTRGEWVSLGTHTLSKGIGGQIRFISEEPDLHADAVLFVKK